MAGAEPFEEIAAREIDSLYREALFLTAGAGDAAEDPSPRRSWTVLEQASSDDG